MSHDPPPEVPSQPVDVRRLLQLFSQRPPPPRPQGIPLFLLAHPTSTRPSLSSKVGISPHNQPQRVLQKLAWPFPGGRNIIPSSRDPPPSPKRRKTEGTNSLMNPPHNPFEHEAEAKIRVCQHERIACSAQMRNTLPGKTYPELECPVDPPVVPLQRVSQHSSSSHGSRNHQPNLEVMWPPSPLANALSTNDEPSPSPEKDPHLPCNATISSSLMCYDGDLRKGKERAAPPRITVQGFEVPTSLERPLPPEPMKTIVDCQQACLAQQPVEATQESSAPACHAFVERQLPIPDSNGFPTHLAFHAVSVTPSPHKTSGRVINAFVGGQDDDTPAVKTPPHTIHFQAMCHSLLAQLMWEGPLHPTALPPNY